MGKWVDSTVLDNGLNQIKNNAIRLLVLNNYTVGDSYATVVAAKLAEVVVAPGDFVISSSGMNRLITTAVKNAVAVTANSSSPDLHFAFTNNVDKVYWVTDETTDRALLSGDQINIPALTYQANQPT